jgi:hypothetical protein
MAAGLMFSVAEDARPAVADGVFSAETRAFSWTEPAASFGIPKVNKKKFRRHWAT